ncbi:MAG: NUDIX domain-containing protein [Thermaerobacter sp.]|nr:NUDIX domain-containing protein [Thermaerobacter sp.]
MTPAPRPQVGVAAIIRDGAGRTVLVRRGQAPYVGTWAFPGGHLEWAETLGGGAEREAAEEAGLTVTARAPLFVGELRQTDERGATVHHFVVVDMGCDWPGGERLRAGTDAGAARWVSATDVEGLALAPGMAECVRDPAVRAFLGW